jgi:alkylation response protein AidB-like acyl-CoA dehydrogenase
MDFDMGKGVAALRSDLRQLVKEHVPPDFLGAFTDDPADLEVTQRFCRLLAEQELLCIAWPEEWGGRGASPWEQTAVREEMWAHHEPRGAQYMGLNWVGPAIMAYGSDEQKRRHLPAIAAGEVIWCQGFSEPEAGSDLAALKTRADIDGDELVITGQKIWTSKAQYADWIYILARTDLTADKHHGISYILVPLGTPGIEVRPIRQITGQAEFNEVFFDSVRVPLINVLGPLHGGWTVAKSTLGFERVGQSRTHRIERRLAILVRMAQEENALTRNGFSDSYVADRIVGFAAQVEALRQISAQATAAGVRGVTPGPEASVAKLLTSEVDQAMATFGLDLAGPAGTLERGSVGAIKNGNVAQSYLLMRAATFGAGTSEIQRNVIGEKLLGLPRDP